MAHASEAGNELTSCHCCGLIQWAPADAPRGACTCRRCRSTLTTEADRNRDNLPAAAVALAGVALFFPASQLPFLEIDQLGHHTESSLLTGVAQLFAHGQWPIGLVVLLFSVILPPVKLGAILLLSLGPSWLGHRHRATTYRLVEQLGRWGMLDVLFVAVLIAFVKLGDLVHFTAGPGLYVFAGFVVTSLLASVLFDPYCLWEHIPTTEVPAEETAVNSQAADDPASDAGSPAARPESAPKRPASSSAGANQKKIPKAEVRPSQRWAWLWMAAPILAVVIAVGAIARSYDDGQKHIAIHFAEGRGLKPGDSLLHRGIEVGRVESVVLSRDLGGVDVTIGLAPEAEPLAVRGSQFWIVRPQFDIAGVAGLETVVGAKYLEVMPGPPDAPATATFVGLEEPPLPDLLEPGGLEIVLQAANSTGIRPGTPIFYRQLRVGGVIKVGLASDASAIEARAYIRPEFRSLIRSGTKFWDAGGVRVSGSLTGFSFQVGPLETLVKAGIGMAIPPDAGPEVPGLFRFPLYERPENEWLAWRPSLPGQQVGAIAARPPLLRSVLDWKESRLGVFTTDRRRFGWTLPVAGGLLGPLDMLQPPLHAHAGSTLLSLPDRSYALSEPCRPLGRGAGVLPVADLRDPWPAERFRGAAGPEDVFLLGDPGREPLFVSAARLTSADQAWVLDPTFAVDPGWHGAMVVSAGDQKIIGILLIAEEGRFVVTPDWNAAFTPPPPTVPATNFR